MPIIRSIIGCQSLTSILTVARQLMSRIIPTPTGTGHTVASDRLLRDLEEGECLLLKAPDENAAGPAHPHKADQASPRRAIELARDNEDLLTYESLKSVQRTVSPIPAFELLPSTLWSDVDHSDHSLGELPILDHNTALSVSSHRAGELPVFFADVHTGPTEPQATRPLAIPHICVIAPEDDATCDNFASQPPTQRYSFWYTDLLTVPGQQVYSFWELTEADDYNYSRSRFEVEEDASALSQMADAHQHVFLHPTPISPSISWGDLTDGLPEIEELKVAFGGCSDPPHPSGTLVDTPHFYDNEEVRVKDSSVKSAFSWSEYVLQVNSLSTITERDEDDEQTSSSGSFTTSRLWSDYSEDEGLPELDDAWVSGATTVNPPRA